MFNGVYSGKRVFVTGHTGFKGSWLCHWLADMGATVAGFSLYVPSEPSHYEVSRLAKRLDKDYTGDIRNYDALFAAMGEFMPDMVFHLAAQPIVSASYEDPKLTFDTNVGGMVNILEAMRHVTGINASVLITSDKCYENVEWEYGYRETDRLGGKDPYSASKACAEAVFSAYVRSFYQSGLSTRVATARAGNVIGGGDWAKDRIVPDCVRSWAKQTPVIIRNPKSTRPWQHVLEPLSGYLWLGTRLLTGADGVHGEAFNFGPTAETNHSVMELVKEMEKTWTAVQWREEPPVPEVMKEAHLLKLCCDKVANRLQWFPALLFSETVGMTSQWYMDYYKGGRDMGQHASAQIRAFHQLALHRGRAWAM